MMLMANQGDPWQAVTAPDAAFAFVPFVIQQNGRTFRPATTFNLRTHANITVAKTYYVKKGGNDGAAGTSWATALEKPATAWLKADADRVIIEAGRYYRSECTGLVPRTMEVIAYGGVVEITNDVYNNLNVFSLVDSHYSTTLTTARTLSFLKDYTNLNALGLPNSLIKKTSIAAVDATANSWW